MDAKSKWGARVAGILARVRKRALIYLVLAYIIYGGGSFIILKFVPERGLALCVQMLLFQVLLIYFSIVEMYTALRGTFEAGLEAQGETVPVFEKLNESAEKIGKLVDRFKPDTLERLEKSLATIAKNTTPPPVTRRPEKEGEEVAVGGENGESR
jgi:hypothetical protein